MNDAPSPLTDDDLSAHLDGEGGPDVADRLAADPAAADRLSELRAAADAVRAVPVVPLEAHVVDALVTRALAAPPSAADGPGAAGDPAGRPLAGRRRANPQWLVAAVVLVLVSAGLALVWSGTHGGAADDTASSAGLTERQADGPASDATESAGSATAGTGGGDAATDGDGTAGSTGQAANLPDLGSFETSDALRSSLATAFPADAAAGTATSDGAPVTEAAVDRCVGLLREVLPVEGDPTHTGFARVGAETVLVYEFTATPDHGSTTTSTIAGQALTTLTTAVRTDACDPLFVFQR